MSARARRSGKKGRPEQQRRSTLGVPSVSAIRPLSFFTVMSRRGWPALLFFFFMASPLVFISGYDSENRLFCTIYDLPKAYFIAIFILLFCFFYSLNLFHKPERTKSLQFFLLHNSGVKVLVLLSLFMAFSLFRAPVREAALFSLVNYLLLGLFFIVLVQLFARKEHCWAAIYGLIAALALFSFFGIIQFFDYKIPFLMPILGPASTFGYRNPAAHFIALVLPFSLFAVWRHWRLWRAHGRALQLTLFIGLLLPALAALVLLFMNYSRTAILALLVEALVLPFVWLVSKKEGVRDRGWKRRSLGRALVGGLVLVAVISALIMVFPESRKRVAKSFKKLQQGPARLLEFRYYHWGNTLMMIKENPVLGVGLGNWRFTYPLYYKSFARDPLFSYRRQVRKTHNDYLQLAAECGIPALLLFLLLLGRQFYLLRYQAAESDGEDDWRLPLAASLLAFLVIMFFSFPMQMAYSRMFCFFLLALGEARVWPALSR